MESLPTADQVLDDVGDKFTGAVAKAVGLARDDLATMRRVLPEFVTQSSARGLANLLHDRLWHHLVVLLDGMDRVTLVEKGPTCEAIVNVKYRFRFKRHHEDGSVQAYPTSSALQFFDQDEQQLVLEGFEEVHLIAGYYWLDESHDVGAAVMSMRDGKDNIVWIIELPEEPAIGAQVDPIHPAEDGPTAPVITLPGAAAADAEAADHE